MKNVVRYQTLVIPGKLRTDVRIIVDDKGAEYISRSDGHNNYALTIHPIISFSIIRPREVGDNGEYIKPQWDPNDSITINRYNLPIMIRELQTILDGMSKIDLFSYTDNRLEINNKIAKTITSTFMIGQSTIELRPEVLKQENDIEVESIRMKFNAETSFVSLTLNDMLALIHSLNNMNIDVLAFNMYDSYIKSGKTNYGNSQF